MSLIDKAKAMKLPGRSRSVVPNAPIREQAEVALAYLHGDIRLAQASAVLAPSKNRSAAQFAIVPILREAIRQGIVRVSFTKDGRNGK